MAPVKDETVETPEVHSTTGDDIDSKPEKQVEGSSANGKEQDMVNPKVEIEEDSEPPSGLEAAIIRQIEYYFSDLNLPRDNFLKEQLQLDDGWVKLTVLTTFNRLAKLSKDTNVIAAALRKSDSGLLEVHESDSKIRRNPDKTLKVINPKDLNSRTLYLKGFPEEATCDDLLSFFDNLVDYERMIFRRDRKTKNSDKHGRFKGSVFLIFKKDRDAMDFLAKSKSPDTDQKVCYKDTELEICSKEEYMARKAAERNKGKQDKEAKHGNKRETVVFDYSKCGVLKLTSLVDETTREDLKDVFKPITSDLFISFEKGAEVAFMRFVDEETAQKCLDQLSGEDKKLKTDKGEFDAVLMSGEEKETAIAKLKADEARIKERKSSSFHGHGSHRGRGGGRGGFRGGRGGGGGNRNPFSKNKGGDKRSGPVTGADDDEPKKKHTKFDSDNEGE